METKHVKAIQNGKMLSSTFIYSTEPPWVLSVEIPEYFSISVDANDLFEAFKIVREKAGARGIKFLCHGARLNVYPSPMTRNMGGGLAAYELTMEKQALRKDLVRIFDETDDAVFSPLEQEKFYKDWINSL